MSERIIIKQLDPAAYAAMNALEKYISNSSIKFTLKELIKIRASQINGCAYCIHLHTADARKGGETEQRIYALSAWWESPLFTEEEKVVLAMTEEITRITYKGLSDETYQQAIIYFSEKEVAEIIMQIVTINAWNRIAISTHLKHKA